MTIRERHFGFWWSEVTPPAERNIMKRDSECGGKYPYKRVARVIDNDKVEVRETIDGSIIGRVLKILTGPAINSDPDVTKAHIRWQPTTPFPTDLRRFLSHFWDVGK